MLKKIVTVLAGLVALLVIAAVAIPFFVDVDKYRPQIEQQADEHLNGKFELGKLSLSLWGQIRIEIAGLKLSDAEGRPVVEVKDAYFHLPFSSILSGSPSLILHMNQPAVNAVKDKAGKLNLMTLVKTQSGPTSGNPGATGAPAQPQPQGATGGGQVALPGIAKRATLGLELVDALVTYKDEKTGISTQVKDLNVKAENISLTRQMSLEITANLDTRMKSATGAKKGESLWMVGPAKITGTAKPSVEGGRFERVELEAHADLDQVEIDLPGLFDKKPGIATHADLAANISPSEADIERLDAAFFNVDVKSSGKLTHLDGEKQPVVSYQLKSNQVDLKSWSELIPMLRDDQLGGTAMLSAEANGPADRLSYKAEARIDDFTAKAGKLKSQPRVDADLIVVPDKADLKATMRAPGNELTIHGNVISFTRPQIKMDVASSGMDLDQLIEFAPPPAQNPNASAGGQAPSATPAAPEDLDAKLIPIRENKSLALAQARIDLNIRSLKARGVAMNGIVGKASLRSLVGSIDSFTMKLFGGQIKSSASVDLKPKTPDYRFNMSVAGLDLGQAVASQMKLFKDTVVGKLALQMNGTGRSFNTDPAIQNLNAKGKMRVTHAAFTSIDVGKMVSDAVNGAIANVANQVPALKGKTIPNRLPSGGSHYDFIASSFTIANGRFDAPDFTTQAVPNQGIDLKGDTAIELKTKALHATWEVIDTYNLTHARDLSVNEMGMQIPHILAEGNGPVKFPITVTGTLNNPQYSYGQVAETLAKVALSNATGALRGQVGSQLQSKAKDLLKQTPPDLQNKLKGLFGG